MGSSAENSSGVHWCKVWEALVQSQVRFNRVPENFPENARKPWCKAKSGSTGSVEGSGEGMGGFGAEVFGEGSGEGLGGVGAG
jgi:hypothetical protein